MFTVSNKKGAHDSTTHSYNTRIQPWSVELYVAIHSSLEMSTWVPEYLTTWTLNKQFT